MVWSESMMLSRVARTVSRNWSCQLDSVISIPQPTSPSSAEYKVTTCGRVVLLPRHVSGSVSGACAVTWTTQVVPVSLQSMEGGTVLTKSICWLSPPSYRSRGPTVITWEDYNVSNRIWHTRFVWALFGCGYLYDTFFLFFWWIFSRAATPALKQYVPVPA